MVPPASDTPALSPVQAQVVQALAQGISVGAAAAAAGLHRTTVYNWLSSETNFAKAVQEARTAYVLSLRDELQDLSRLALSAVRRLLEDPDTPAGILSKLALAVLRRPQFTSDGAWNLPVPAAALASQQTGAAPSAAEAAALRGFAQKLGNIPIRQNSTESRENPAPAAPAPKSPSASQPPAPPKVGRNEPCPCGSSRKFKHCCLGRQASPRDPAAGGRPTAI